jgi:hypothetical protein
LAVDLLALGVLRHVALTHGLAGQVRVGLHQGQLLLTTGIPDDWNCKGKTLYRTKDPKVQKVPKILL